MKKLIKVMSTGLFIFSLSLTGTGRLSVNATSTCQELAKKYETKLSGDAQNTVYAESGDTCAFSIVITPGMSGIDGSTIKGEQQFFVVKKDGTEIKQQQLLYENKDKEYFPKVDRILVKSSGDFYAISYKLYPTFPTSFNVGVGYVAKVSKSNGEVLWQRQAQFLEEKSTYTFSDTRDIVEGETTLLIGNAVKTTGNTDYDERKYMPQITQVKDGQITGATTFSNYENYEAVTIEKLANSYYVVKLQERGDYEIANPKTKEIITDGKFTELVGETRESIAKQAPVEEKKEEIKQETSQPSKEEVPSKEETALSKEEKKETDNTLLLIIGLLSAVVAGGITYYVIQKRKKDKKETIKK